MFREIKNVFQRLALHSQSLYHNVDTNVCEQFNSIVAKTIGGKRINFSLGRSFDNRCHAAVIQHNTHHGISTFLETAFGIVAPVMLKKMESNRYNKRKRWKPSKQKKIFATETYV